MRLLFLVALAGCGRFGFVAGDERSDALADGQLGAFTAVTPLAGFTSGDDDDDPSLTADQLLIVFDSNAVGGLGSGDIWFATRASPSEPFGPKTLIAELSSAADDTAPEVTADGLTLYFGSDRLGAANRDLFVTTRPDRASPWSAPTQIVELASPSHESCAIESGDGLQLFFDTERGGIGDIYVARRSARGQPWTQIELLAGFGSPAAETQHWINADATAIYFTYATHQIAQTDIWFATRASPDEPFGPPQLLPGINTSENESDPWLTPDERTIYFARGPGADIFTATR